MHSIKGGLRVRGKLEERHPSRDPIKRKGRGASIGMDNARELPVLWQLCLSPWPFCRQKIVRRLW